MDSFDSIEKASEHAVAALSLMEKLRISPTPKNYTIWYAYLAEGYPELKRVLNLFLEKKKAFTDERGEEIFSQFFELSREAEEIREIGKRIENSLIQLNKIFSDAGNEASRYELQLKDFSGKITNDVMTGELQTVIGDLYHETQKMMDHTRFVEDEMNRSTAEIVELRNELKTARDESLTDPLTGIANRRCFNICLGQATSNSRETGAAMCLLMLDIDRFKEFNDRYGHQIGDEVLRLVARILQRSVRDLDTASRYGGEEFAIILPETTLEDACRLAERIHETVGTRKITRRSSEEDYGTITLSIGVALYERGEPPDDLVARADEVLYVAKQRGRDQVVSEEALRRPMANRVGDQGQ